MGFHAVRRQTCYAVVIDEHGYGGLVFLDRKLKRVCSMARNYGKPCVRPVFAKVWIFPNSTLPNCKAINTGGGYVAADQPLLTRAQREAIEEAWVHWQGRPRHWVQLSLFAPKPKPKLEPEPIVFGIDCSFPML